MYRWSVLMLLSLLATCGPLRAQDDVASIPIEAKTFVYGEKDVLRVNAKVRFTTVIVLPKNESILDFTCGDRDFWIVNGNQNFAYVKPAREKSATNLNLVTASGNVYSFLLTEVSGEDGVEPDLKVFVEPREQSAVAAINATPRFFTAEQVEDYRQQAEIATAAAREAKLSAQATIAQEISAFRSQYPTALQFSYRFGARKKPFFVSAIYHDDKFTYIQANPQETPALYEVKDGKPNLIQFEYRNGTYIVSKVLDDGYLVIGKQRMGFARLP